MLLQTVVIERLDVACGDLRVVVPGVDVGIPCDDDCTFPGCCYMGQQEIHFVYL